MKYAVIGSREFTDYSIVKRELDKYKDIDWIVSGKCKGVDSLGERYAEENGIPTIIYPADWKDFNEPCIKKTGKYGKYNALAGFNRNQKIINDCDVVIAFWNMVSNGTKDSINKAKKANKKVIIVEV